MKVSEERAREYGEVLTPVWVAERMINSLPNTRGKVLDIGVGQGVFILELLRRKLASQKPETVEQIYETIEELHGTDILEDNIQTTQKHINETINDYCSTNNITLDQGRVVNILNANITLTDVLENPNPEWEDGYFSIIVSNPPYQRNISRSTVKNRLRNHSKAVPYYHLFYDYARSLNPTYVLFIMPAKWYAGGWGLDKWRQTVIAEKNIRELHDYRFSKTVFPTAEVNGGICWLLRDNTYEGEASVSRYGLDGKKLSTSRRFLKEGNSDFFMRDEKSATILQKVGTLNGVPNLTSIIAATTPFGIASNFKEYSTTRTASKGTQLYYIKKHTYWVGREQVTKNLDLLDKWKVFLSLSYDQHSNHIIGEPVVFAPNSACTHSYIAFGGFSTKEEADNLVTYMRTKLFRFLAAQLKITPIATRQVYRLIPLLDFSKPWTDEELYRKYGLSLQEQTHIEQIIADWKY